MCSPRHRLPGHVALTALTALTAIVALVAVLGLACCSPPAFAQETTGRLEGRVLDARGAPIADVNVGVTSPALQGGRGCLTDAGGRFVLLSLPVGEYQMKLQHLAYQTRVIDQVRVRLAQTTTLGEVRLADQVLDQPEVRVTAERLLIDPGSSEIGGVLEAREYSALPIERDYRSAMYLLPQANLSYLGDPLNVAGATGGENRYYVDGIDGTDPVSGLSGTGLPYNFVQQVELRAGGYMPEYRSALGGIVNAVTWSGGNEVKAQAFGYYTKNRIGVDPRFRYGADRGDYENYDLGAGLGGPIVRDRLWYYLAYNPTFTREEVEIPGQGFFPDRATTHSFAGKLTWRFNPRNTLVLTSVGDPTTRDAVGDVAVGGGGVPVTALNPDVMLTDIQTGRVSIAAEERSLLTDNFVLRSTLSWTRFRNRNVPATEYGRSQVLFVVDSTGVQSGGPGASADDRTTVALAGVMGTWVTRRHEVKAGLEYKDIQWEVDDLYDVVNARVDGLYGEFIIRSNCDVGYRIPSGFVQDSWRLTDRIRVNGGLRWDGLYFVASDGSVAQSIVGQWQPRLGVIWEPGQVGTQKLSASAGRYYQDPSTFPLLVYYNLGSVFRSVAYDHDPRFDPSGGTVEFEVPGQIQASLPGLQGQHFDEVTLGYQRLVGKRDRFGVDLVYRELRQGLEDGMDPESGAWQFNNPGSGLLSDFPRMYRQHAALTLSWNHRAGERMSWLASYVLSRTRGNYPGMFNTDFGYGVGNANGSFDFLDQLRYADGPLPNDRTHVLKFSGRYDAGAGFTFGLTTGWQSGTPLDEFGSKEDVPLDPVLVTPRGTAGRTPDLWDLSVRVGYEVPVGPAARVRPRVNADFMHIGNLQKAVTYEELHYRSGTSDWVFSNPNPNYLVPTQQQPGFAVRLGVEAGF